MTPAETAYRAALEAHGLRIRVNGMSGLLETASRLSNVVSRLVEPGVFRDGGDEVLLVPNDPEVVRELTSAMVKIAASDLVGSLARVQARSFLREFYKLTGTTGEVPEYSEAAGESCGPQTDPKVTESEILAALKQVGTPKAMQRVYLVEDTSGESDDEELIEVADEDDLEETKKRKKKYLIAFDKKRSVHRPAGRLTVACGLGVDSAAILVGLAQEYEKSGDEKWLPEIITFADTGGEHPETYRFLSDLNDYLDRVGFPRVTVVSWATEMTSKGWGTGVTLEINSLNNHTVPSISVGGHSCSNKFKILPQQAYLAHFFAGKLGENDRVIRAIGYDATETKRLIKGGTYVASKEEDGAFQAWYPLVEWGWDRARCMAEIAVAFGSRSKPAWDLVPRKSSCFFCGAMTPEEILLLVERGHKDLLKRAIFMEQVALMSWSHAGPPKKFKGLGRQFAWTDFALARTDRLNPRQRVLIEGGVLREDKAGKWVARHVGPPSEFTDPRPGDRIVEASGLFPLLTVREVEAIKAAALRWIEASPKKQGEQTQDLAFTKEAMALPAYRDILGFRGTDHMSWDRMGNVVETWERREQQGNEKATEVLKGLASLTKKLYGGRRLPVL